tara:strand:+ start:32183 stop:33835 length:1653 start_codon:yes stop_codon:yes gene_type:complete
MKQRLFTSLLVILISCLATASIAHAQEAYDCKVGELFNQLAATKDTFSHDIFKAVGPEVKKVLGGIISLFILISVAISLVSGNAGMLKKLFPTLACAGIAIIILQDGISSTQPYVLEISNAIEQSSLQAGALIVSKTNGHVQALTEGSNHYPKNGVNTENGYATLACQIEYQGFKVSQIMINIAQGDGGFGVAAILRGFLCIIAMLPFVFVIGIFAAFMVEAMFKYVAITILAPLLVGLYWLKPARAVSSASLRVLLGAWLTIILASGAMGFTLQGIDTFSAKMNDLLAGVQQLSNPYTAKRYYHYCKDMPFYPNPDSSILNSEKLVINIDSNDPDLQPPLSEDACEDQERLVNLGSWIVLDPNFLIMPVIGLISILLHMQSKSLASNLSGANDGAGPAAAVVMGAKMLAGGAAMGAMKIAGGANTAAFGAGGARSSISDMMSGRSNIDSSASGAQQMGQALHQGGMVGGLRQAARSFGLQSAPKAPEKGADPLAGVGAGQYSTGGGAGSSAGGGGAFSNPQERQAFAKDIASAFAQMNGGGFGGRNRDG